MVAILVLMSCVVLVTAEHSGAYSSPQYAKKMYPKQYDSNALLPNEKNPVVFKRHVDRFDGNGINNTEHNGRSSFFESAGSFLNGAGGQVMATLANDFIARSTGSSQVLSLNLTNLVILVVLKALILAAGFFGAGAWKGGHQYGRSIDDNKNASYLTEGEVLMYLTYLSGQQNSDYSCLYKLACQQPKQAAMYASSAELLLQGAKLLQGNSVEFKDYEDVSAGIKQAAEWGDQGMACDARYKCQ